MFLAFFAALRKARVPVTPREFLDLMRALEADLADKSVDDFYRLSRALLVKDERNLDKFDVVFAEVFRGALTPSPGVEPTEIPAASRMAVARNDVVVLPSVPVIPITPISRLGSPYHQAAAVARESRASSTTIWGNATPSTGRSTIAATAPRAAAAAT